MRAISIPLFLVTILFSLATSALRSQEPQRQRADSTQTSEMSQKQIEHSKLYREYSGIGDLRSAAAKSTGDVEVLRGVGQKIFFPDAPPINLEEYVAAMTRRSDAIVIGVVNDRNSFLTAEGTFVFTDYSLTVDQVLKNNPAAELIPSNSIVVTRPGGKLRFGGRNIEASDESLAPFEVGRRYLLFLNYIPTTDAYKAFDSRGAFRIDGTRTAKVTKDQLPIELEDGVDVTDLMTYIRTAVR